MINFMNILESVYVNTTNPEQQFKNLLRLDVLFSVLFHSIIYTTVIYLFFNTIFPQKKIISFVFYKKLFFIFLIIMCIGYPLRLWKAKAIFFELDDGDDGDERRLEVTYNQMGMIYRTWYFLG